MTDNRKATEDRMNSKLDRICYFCQKTFSSPSKLLRHIAVHTKEAPYLCGVCFKGFKSNLNLKIHMTSHMTQTEKTEFISKFKHGCKFCDKKFHSKNLLNQHILSHTKEKAFQCEICKQGFSIKTNLKMHKRIVHEKIKPFSCTKCEKTFAKKQNLKSHLIVHSEARDLKCLKCQKTFRHKITWNNHMKLIHSNQSEKDKFKASWKFCCYFCNKICPDNAKLEEHMRIHTKETPFSCDECFKGFARNYHLNSHKKIHLSNEEKIKFKLGFKYVCKFCQKRFQVPTKLQRHILSHTKEKSLNCNICKIGFSQRGNLNMHKKSVH